MVYQGPGQGGGRRTSGHGHGENVDREVVLRCPHDHFTSVLDQFEGANRTGDKGNDGSTVEFLPAPTDDRGHFDDFLQLIPTEGPHEQMFTRVVENGLGIMDLSYFLGDVVGPHGSFIDIDLIQGVGQFC